MSVSISSESFRNYSEGCLTSLFNLTFLVPNVISPCTVAYSPLTDLTDTS